ncbi:MAG: mechanosensitive ion channel [candidate division Zixibacteria bacterium]|nr:mechanosensitive ion channel [candidate division Zixibacteria bacterium]
MMDFLEKVIYHNSILSWIIAAAVAVGAVIIMRIAKGIIARNFKKYAEGTANNIDDLIAETIHKVNIFPLITIGIFAGAYTLTLSGKVTDVIGTIVLIGILVQILIWANTGISFWVRQYREKRQADDPAAVTTISAMAFVAKLLLWLLVFLLVLDNAGVDITGLVAGLGIGGIAVALAVQNILGDLFSSLSIVLDKPFVIGDFIIVDNYMGVVEHIGLKTTRIRSLSGEQLVMGNSDLLKSRIRNYKRMAERRIVFTFGVVYQTPKEKLERIPGLVKEIVEQTDNTRFDRAHFKAFADFSLNFEVVYYVTQPDYNLYMDVQQNINLGIYKRLAEEGIEFAYPTQTLYINKLQDGEEDNL